MQQTKSDINWTPNQEKAIKIDNDKVIVSAAAGSGKTGVLTQRVIRLVKEKNDIRRMLIMTFTNAAAAEMKKRIIAALLEEAQKAQRENSPEAEYLFEQAEFADSANISTFHSFCIELLRENFNIADVSPNFKILSDGEAEALQHEAMREVLDELYEKRDENLIKLLTRYTSKFREENLVKMLLEIYDKARAQPGKFKWITNGAEMGKTRTVEEKAEKIYGEYEHCLRKRLKFYAENMAVGIELENSFNQKMNKKASNREEDLEILKSAINSNLEDAYTIITQLKFKSAPSECKKYTEEEIEEVKEIKKYLITAGDLKEETLKPGNPVLIEDEISHTDRDAHAIAEIIKKFDDVYSKKKKERNGVDFDDTMIKTIEVLEQNDDIAHNFDYIFVDEYQDTNPVQHEIIDLLKRDNPAVNLFMVGDMKQSIYRFRNANPQLFKGKLENRDDSNFTPITMNDNFRSSEAVINAVNGVMESLMCEEFGEVEYGQGERLVGKKQGGKVALLLGEVDEAEIKKSEGADLSLSKKELKAEIEAQAIADSIEQTLNEVNEDGSPKYEPKDIAILARKIKGNDVIKAIMKKLSEKGILYSLAKNQLSDTPEIELFVNLLKIIDNPKNDVALVSVLKSDIGGFDENELAEIHIFEAEGTGEKSDKLTETSAASQSKAQIEDDEVGYEDIEEDENSKENDGEEENKHRYFKTFYGQLYDNKNNNKDAKIVGKIEKFLNLLIELRLLSQTVSLSDFVSLLRDRFDFDSKHTFMKNGNSKRSVFEKFMDYVQEICAYSGNNLYRLISELESEKKRSENKSYINIETDDDIPAVSIMTMHKSKGLEFPVVYLVNLKGELEKRNDGIYKTSNEYGLVLPYRNEENSENPENPKKREKRDGIMLTIVKEKLKREDKSEYLRLLYVAMTRAKERLYLCGTVDKDKTPYVDKEINAASANTMLDWIIAAKPEKCGIEVIDTVPLYSLKNDGKDEFKDPVEDHIKDILRTEKAAELITPIKGDGIPQKISVSDIKEAQSEEDDSRSYKIIGDYLKAAAGNDEEEVLSAAAIGTLIHKLMEYIMKYKLNTADAAKKMKADNLLSDAEYEAVIENGYMAEGFLESELYKRMQKADKVLEEQRFLLNVPSDRLGLDKDAQSLVTVQGILDAAFLEDGKWVLIDYKTDKVDGKELEKRAEHYKIQLDLYSDALKEITGIPVKERYLYFLRPGKLKAV